MTKIFYNIQEIIDEVLANFVIDGTVKKTGNTDKLFYGEIVDEDLIFLISFNESNLKHVISVDNRKCFNKTSQCPIHFNLDLSRRKAKRLTQALNYLRTKEGERDSATFQWRGWDEFDYTNRDNYYLT